MPSSTSTSATSCRPCMCILMSTLCLEVIVLRGHTELVQSIANLIFGTKGVQNGKLVLTRRGTTTTNTDVRR